MAVDASGNVRSIGPRTYAVGADAGDHWLDKGKSLLGVPLVRTDLTPDSLVVHQGVQSKISDLLIQGLVVPDPSGGFMEAPQQLQESQQQGAYRAYGASRR